MSDKESSDLIGSNLNPEQENHSKNEIENSNYQNIKTQLKNVLSKILKYEFLFSPLILGIIIISSLYLIIYLYTTPYPDFMYFYVLDTYVYNIRPEFLQELCFIDFEFYDYGYIYFPTINNLIINYQYFESAIFWVLFLVYVRIVTPNKRPIEIQYIVSLNYLIIILASISYLPVEENARLIRLIYLFYLLFGVILIIFKFLISLKSVKAKEQWFQDIVIKEKIKAISIDFGYFIIISIVFVNVMKYYESFQETFIYLLNAFIFFFGISFVFICMIKIFHKKLNKEIKANISNE